MPSNPTPAPETAERTRYGRAALAASRAEVAKLGGELEAAKVEVERLERSCDRAWISGAKTASNYFHAGNQAGLTDLIIQRQLALARESPCQG